MAIFKLGDQVFECIEHIEVGSGIEVSRGESRSRVQHGKLTKARDVCKGFLDNFLKIVGEINHLTLLRRVYFHPLHS
jgi:hypothetical protein